MVDCQFYKRPDSIGIKGIFNHPKLNNLIAKCDFFNKFVDISFCQNECKDRKSKSDLIPITNKGVEIKNKPLPTFKKAKTVIMAIANGKRIENQDRIDKRLEICSSCEFAKKTEKGELWCGKCGCSVSSDDRKILNLAAYEENLPIYGCKANGPKGPSKWQENGV